MYSLYTFFHDAVDDDHHDGGLKLMPRRRRIGLRLQKVEKEDRQSIITNEIKLFFLNEKLQKLLLMSFPTH